MRTVKNAIPVYDICSLSGNNPHSDAVIAARFADYLRMHPNLYLAHGHSFYHVVFFTQGSGHYTIDFQQFPVVPGSAYFMVPGQVHSWAFEGEVDGYVVNFSEALFQSFLSDDQYLSRFPFFSGDAGRQIIQLDREAQAAATAMLEDVVTEYHRHDAFHLDAARMQLLHFFILAARAVPALQSGAGQPAPNMLVLQHFRKLVNQYYTRYKLPKDYATMLYVTPNYLNALCKDLLGKPAGEVIRERILLEAKRQLVNLDERIAGIGYNLGFTDNSYFTKFFRKYAGQTPEDFRKQQAATAQHP